MPSTPEFKKFVYSGLVTLQAFWLFGCADVQPTPAPKPPENVPTATVEKVEEVPASSTEQPPYQLTQPSSQPEVKPTVDPTYIPTRSAEPTRTSTEICYNNALETLSSTFNYYSVPIDVQSKTRMSLISFLNYENYSDSARTSWYTVSVVMDDQNLPKITNGALELRLEVIPVRGDRYVSKLTYGPEQGVYEVSQEAIESSVGVYTNEIVFWDTHGMTTEYLIEVGFDTEHAEKLASGMQSFTQRLKDSAIVVNISITIPKEVIPQGTMPNLSVFTETVMPQGSQSVVVENCFVAQWSENTGRYESSVADYYDCSTGQ